MDPRLLGSALPARKRGRADFRPSGPLRVAAPPPPPLDPDRAAGTACDTGQGRMTDADRGRGLRSGRVKAALAALATLPLMACTDLARAQSGVVEPAPRMLWDGRPGAADWTATALQAVAAEDDKLTQVVPRDIAAWCPDYPQASVEDRRAFWAGLLSAVAKHESTWNPAAVGGGGRWFGLLQIAPATARQYGCSATSAGALKDGGANLACAIEIASVNVARDRAVAGDGRAGLGRDWGPFRSSQKRAEMAAWTAVQDYCRS